MRPGIVKQAFYQCVIREIFFKKYLSNYPLFFCIKWCLPSVLRPTVLSRVLCDLSASVRGLEGIGHSILYGIMLYMALPVSTAGLFLPRDMENSPFIHVTYRAA